jgi:hypothetical protein
MKTTYHFLLIVVLWLGFASCKDVLCINIDCGHGTCNGKTCECEDGWEKDVNGSCKQQALCSQTDCVHGTCNSLGCDCEPGWQRDADGHCTQPVPCYNVDCGHGFCSTLDGSCNCDIYYVLGSDGTCSKSWSQIPAGTWRGTHQVTFGGLVGPYDFTIAADSLQPSIVWITNFGNETCAASGDPLLVRGTMGSASTLVISQSLCTGIAASGHMTLQGMNSITVSGTITYNSSFVTFDGVFTRL